MRLTYTKCIHRFPIWGRFNNLMLGKERYTLSENNTLVAEFDDNSVLPHYNHVEMSGFESSTIISYLVKRDRTLRMRLYAVIPQLRVNPNVTQSSLCELYKGITLRAGESCEKVEKISFDGTLTITGSLGRLTTRRMYITAFDKKNLIEIIELDNTSNVDIEVVIDNRKPLYKIANCYTATGKTYILRSRIFLENKELLNRKNKLTVYKNSKKSLYTARGFDNLTQDEIKQQVELRHKFIRESSQRMVITTPDININSMIEFCKIRASESIFNTKNGLMHAPGGGHYYAALWTNDQCEYANPLFAYLGYDKAKEQSENCYTLYSKLASADKAIYTSIIACGDGYWHGAGDRGDTSMYLYGLTRYLLTHGDKELAKTFIPSIELALAFVKTKINEDNVVESDSDELENRFESGKANLSTAVITYDALVSLEYLFDELGYKQKSTEVGRLAQTIAYGIETYFAGNVEGYDTYRYCREENNLRSWICLPLTVGMDSRASGTVKAIMSDRLRMKNGILSRSGERTYWDRSTLYAIRGMFTVGAHAEAYDLLNSYTKERLLGEHIPYPVEAYPEGNAAHLSAESALYLRIFTEGIIGYRPTGFNSFTLKPNLPNEWNFIKVTSIELCGISVDIDIERDGAGYKVIVNGNAFKTAGTLTVTLNGAKVTAE